MNEWIKTGLSAFRKTLVQCIWIHSENKIKELWNDCAVYTEIASFSFIIKRIFQLNERGVCVCIFFYLKESLHGAFIIREKFKCIKFVVFIRKSVRHWKKRKFLCVWKFLNVLIRHSQKFTYIDVPGKRMKIRRICILANYPH